MKRALFGITAVAVLATPAAGQTVRLDEGTFRILVGGREVGTETFSLRQNGTGDDAVVIAQGRVVLDSNETTANVQLAGAGLRLVAYDVELSGADARRIRASVSRGRASSRTLSAAGETMKEYLVSDGAVLLDDGVAHHYYMIARRAEAGATQTAILIPRESRQVQATITQSGPEPVSIGGASVQARKIVVQPAGGDPRTVWVDGQNRVLRVEIPARNYVAVRTEAP
ncbi:MAG TPA: hypothetical protein VFZ69_16195 [Longimicrobiales bacterium]